jgi:hypothetical protein
VALAAILKGLGTSYLAGALSGFGSVSGPARANNINIGDFRRLQAQMTSNLAASVDLSDLKDLEKQLREVSPALYHKFRRDQKKLGVPAKDAVQKTFRNVNVNGPLKGPKRPGRRFDKMATSELGRLSWYASKLMSQDKAIDVNYKNRRAQADLSKLKLGADGTLSIVRVRVMAPAYVVADMAGKTGSAAKATGTLTRDYTINLFGRGVVTRRHRIDSDNVENWLRRMDDKASNSGQNSPSRYGWPTMEKHAPKYRADASKLLNETIATLSQRMQ